MSIPRHFLFSFLWADCRFLSPLHWTPPFIYLSLLFFLPGLTVVCTSLPATSWPLGSRSRSSSSKGACTVLRRTSRPEPPLRGAWAPAVHAKWARREQHCSQLGPSDHGRGGVTARRKAARMAYRAGRSVKICLWRFFFFFSLLLFFPYEPLDFSPFSRRAQTPFVRYSFCLSFHSCASNSSFRSFVLFCSSPAVAVLGGRAAVARYFVLACVIVFG